MLKPVTLIVLVACVAPLSSAAKGLDAPTAATDAGPRVRPVDSRAAAVLLEGIARSATVRSLVDRLEELNVIVYLESQPGLRRGLAGTLTFMTTTPTFRYVRISLSPMLSADMLISVLGHELQHALEVAQARSIVSDSSLEAYYRRHGIAMKSHTSGWDTFAARDAGELVRREIAGTHASRVAESIQAFDPDSWHIVYRRARDRFTSR
jgi:hypothetical protein